MMLLNISPNSVNYGSQIPISLHLQTEETHWQPEGLLSISPYIGVPLEPATQYAAVLTNECFLPANQASDPRLDKAWIDIGNDLNDISANTVFTTQNPIIDLANIANRINTNLSIPPLNQTLSLVRDTQYGQYLDGEILVPLWQFGEKPYISDGGFFAYGSDGQPKIAEWEPINFRMVVPDGDPPVDGWPIVIYSHGTGGDYSTYANSIEPLEVGHVLLKGGRYEQEHGFVGIGISQPLHAERGTGADPSLFSFNYLNPASARTMFRQGAADQIYLANLLSTNGHNLIAPNGEPIHLNTSKISYFGHSHGGQVGSLALPFIGHIIESAILSGTGGVLSVTLMLRDAGDFNIAELITAAIELSENEEIAPHHPVISLVQMVAEAADPINYAPYWHYREGWWHQRPVSVLQTEGINDTYTPSPSTDALAASANSPIIGELVQSSDALKWMGLTSSNASALENQLAYNGSRSHQACSVPRAYFVIFRKDQL